MYSIILRTTVDSQDQVVAAASLAQYQTSLATLLSSLQPAPTSPYLLARLLNCSRAAPAPTPPGHCPRIFDSWSCFPAAPAGTFQSAACPQFPSLKYGPGQLAYKYCDTDGGWWVALWSTEICSVQC